MQPGAPREDTESTRHFFEHQGIQFHCQRFGHGRPFVFCHGLTGDVEHPKQLLLPDVPPAWQLIVWDCRLHGLTRPDSAAGDTLSFELFASDLAALLDHLRIGAAAIGGVSMGAGVAARFAADHPGRAPALVLVRPAWIDQPHPPNLSLIEQVGAKLAELDGAEVLHRYETDPRFMPDAARSAAAAETLRQLCLAAQSRERSLRLRAMPASVPLRRGDLARLTMPALVLGNHHDPIHPFAMAQWWAQARGAIATLLEVPSKSLDLAAHQQATRRHVWDFLQQTR